MLASLHAIRICQFPNKNDRTFLLVAFLRSVLTKFCIFCFIFVSKFSQHTKLCWYPTKLHDEGEKILSVMRFVCCPISATERALVSMSDIFNQHRNKVERRQTRRTENKSEYENKQQFSHRRLMAGLILQLAGLCNYVACSFAFSPNNNKMISI